MKKLKLSSVTTIALFLGLINSTVCSANLAGDFLNYLLGPSKLTHAEHPFEEYTINSHTGDVLVTQTFSLDKINRKIEHSLHSHNQEQVGSFGFASEASLEKYLKEYHELELADLPEMFEVTITSDKKLSDSEIGQKIKELFKK